MLLIPADKTKKTKIWNRKWTHKFKCGILQLVDSSYDDVSQLFELIIYVDEYLGEDMKVRYLSERIWFSKSKLQNLCKVVYGNSLSKETTERRIIKALDLFEENGDSVSAVGHKLGYTNMCHFAKAFKKVHGFLPSAYFNKKGK